MNAIELLNIISTGETSKVQFKETLPNQESISREIVAMSNSPGWGVILLGVRDRTGEVTGLTVDQIEYADRKVAEFADNIKPPVYLFTEVVKVDDKGTEKNVLIVQIKEGINKPYKTQQGEIYVKSMFKNFVYYYTVIYLILFGSLPGISKLRHCLLFSHGLCLTFFPKESPPKVQRTPRDYCHPTKPGLDLCYLEKIQ